MAGAGKLFGRRVGAVGMALTAWDIWRRLPPEYRKQILAATRKHGPRLAMTAAKRYSQYKRRFR
jgi:hypothetical protein